jgi:hypothetical protein
VLTELELEITSVLVGGTDVLEVGRAVDETEVDEAGSTEDEAVEEPVPKL